MIQVYAENVHILETTLTPAKRINTKCGLVLDVIVTKRYDMYGVEIKINSMKRDGTESWVVISRGTELFLTDLAPDYVDSMCVDQHTLSSGNRSVDGAAKCVDVMLIQS